MKVIGFAGFSGAGKTTLIEKVIPRLVARGLAVSLVKHAHHRFDIDHPGKDSFRHREAGATEVLLTSDMRWALMHELRGGPEPTLADHLRRMGPCDLVLVEGFKAAEIPKIEVHRTVTGHRLIHPDDPAVIAVASDVRVSMDLPWLDLADPEAVAAFAAAHARRFEPPHTGPSDRPADVRTGPDRQV